MSSIFRDLAFKLNLIKIKILMRNLKWKCPKSDVDFEFCEIFVNII